MGEWGWEARGGEAGGGKTRGWGCVGSGGGGGTVATLAADAEMRWAGGRGLSLRLAGTGGWGLGHLLGGAVLERRAWEAGAARCRRESLLLRPGTW